MNTKSSKSQIAFLNKYILTMTLLDANEMERLIGGHKEQAVKLIAKMQKMVFEHNTLIVRASLLKGSERKILKLASDAIYNDFLKLEARLNAFFDDSFDVADDLDETFDFFGTMLAS